ncbi:hypothetical protein AArcSl_1608 [Halalkaliarchaeum desulfuricum]|uniref:Uncharacterized protein n=1 Tax=Halalkaliarchaeum desulfuricum TaxID=2055893 RepID=A0A343TJG5_9EURY|nr:hypothetical protein [Halalkaliarchaeum desulfuricum]AUX09237.1 hypothetical protein AArcSl_1608 [Halalkaliarchaeum desulfuricum]
MSAERAARRLQLASKRTLGEQERDAIGLLHRAGWPVPELSMVFETSDGTIRRHLREQGVTPVDARRQQRVGLEHPLEREAIARLWQAGWSLGELALAFGCPKALVWIVLCEEGVLEG